MSEKPSEYLKRTCLICGCHTNQTINIYEPRSGPNIVQLIQAKFKFQPLNEDKYLCFSCNNWLINWHSLQAMNSNDAESSSGTFRSSLNNLMSEKGSGASKQDIFNFNQNQTKPIARIRPQQLQTSNDFVPMRTTTTALFLPSFPKIIKRKKLHYSKRNFLSCQRLKMQSFYKFKRCMQICCVCGRSIVILHSTKTSPKKTTTIKCRKCRIISMYLKNINFQEKIQKNKSNNVDSYFKNLETYQYQKYQRPLVDGKIVAMLRRLGTTLSREEIHDTEHMKVSSLPQIMSPAKKKHQWKRQMDSDEILIDFETAITEVLPIIQKHNNNASQIQSRKKLTFNSCNANNKSNSNEIINLDEISEKYFDFKIENIIPKGLSVSIISPNDEVVCY